MRSYPPLILAGLILAAGCTGSSDDGTYPTPTASATPMPDNDNDAYAIDEGDCDDWNKNVYPRAPELADFLDNDCDGDVDEDTLTGDDDYDGYSEADGDCDDQNRTIYPDATEVRNGVDEDCDGVIDEDVGTLGEDLTPPAPEDPTSDLARAVLFNDLSAEVGQGAWLSNLRALGDFDDDGRQDVAFSQNQADGGGRLHLYYGDDDQMAGVTTLQAAADATFTGYVYPNTAGAEFAGAGDVNGDGIDDLLIGDPKHREVGVFFGGPRYQGEFALDVADVRIRAGQDSGFSIGRFITLGDFNGDGIEDIALSQPDYDYGRGRVSIILGRGDLPQAIDIAHADATLFGDEDFAFFGFESHCPGDIDGDGTDDLIIGSPSAIIVPEQDTDGNGTPDIPPLLGDLQLFFGDIGHPEPTPGPRFVVEDRSVLTDLTIVGGDLDQDGALDLAIAIPFDEAGAGQILIHYGSEPFTSGTHPLSDLAHGVVRGKRQTSDGEGEGESEGAFGSGLALGDLDLDGHLDIVASAQRSVVSTDGDFGDPEAPEVGPGYVMVLSNITEPFEGTDLKGALRTIHDGAPGIMEAPSVIAIPTAPEGESPEVWVGTSFLVYDVPTTGVLIFDGEVLP